MSDEKVTDDINFKDLDTFYEDTICGITFFISRYIDRPYMYYSTIIIDEKYSDVINFFNTDLCNRHFLNNEKLPEIIKATYGIDNSSMELTFKHSNFKRIKLESINVINEILKAKKITTYESPMIKGSGMTEDFYNQIRRLRTVSSDFDSPEMERIYYESGRRYVNLTDSSILGVKLESYLIRYKDYYFTIFHLDERHRKAGLFGYYFIALVIANDNISEDKLKKIFGDKYYGIYKKENDEKLHKDYKYHIIKTDFEWNRDDAENWFKEEIDKLK
mgnify:CR=1 FL=1